jgi:hypothetical protein
LIYQHIEKMSEYLSNTDLFNSLITAAPATPNFESRAEAAEHRGWMAEYHAHETRQQARAAEDPTQYGAKVSQYQVEAALCYFNANRYRAHMAEERARMAKDPIQAAKERAQAAEYRARSTNWLLQSIRKRGYTVQAEEARRREIVASFCSFHIARHRKLAAEEWGRAAKNPDQAAEEYGAATEAYAQEIQDWLSSPPKDFPDITGGIPMEYINTIGEEFVDAFGDWMSEEYNYLADAAEYRAQKHTQSYQCAQNCHMDDSLTVKRKAVATQCHDLAAAERQLAAKNRVEALRFRVAFAENVLYYFTVQPIQNSVREVAAYLAHAVNYVIVCQTHNKEVHEWIALSDNTWTLVEILQGLQELIIAKKAYVVGKWDSSQIITCLLSYLSASYHQILNRYSEKLSQKISYCAKSVIERSPQQTTK